MKKFLAAAAAVGMIAVAAPASAEHDRYDRYERDYDRGDDRDYRYDDRQGVNAYARELRWRMERGIDRGRLSYREAGRVNAGLGEVIRLERWYRRNGLDAWERRDLIRRLARVDTLLRSEMRDRNDYRG